MIDFAGRTGLCPPEATPRRYLWTDAFAVCNYLELYRRTGEKHFLDMAVALIGQVHGTLGRHRPDDKRRGWISGLSEDEGRLHPTAAGLRIGKDVPERRPGEPYDETREWDRDGQYYHYLTKWMHALQRTATITGNAEFSRMARELAHAAHTSFTYRPPAGGPLRMYWKMSIDLSHPLVPSTGRHDPLDGLITFHELCGKEKSAGCDLQADIDELAPLCRNRDWTTDDPLGLGGLLCDAVRSAQLIVKGAMGSPGILENIVSSAKSGLLAFSKANVLALPAQYRLAFREFGLSIGLRAMVKLRHLLADNRSCLSTIAIAGSVQKILGFGRMADMIEDFWLDAAHQRADSWTAHRDINEVMLATSLAPDEFLTC